MTTSGPSRQSGRPWSRRTTPSQGRVPAYARPETAARLGRTEEEQARPGLGDGPPAQPV
ncbi:hypothetical protein [Streptomyces tendae]